MNPTCNSTVAMSSTT